MSEKKKIKCACCGMELSEKDFKKAWRNCHWCKMPICFNCAHYIGVSIPGLYTNYVDVIRVCKNCRPKKMTK